jgi:hypothetical protein
LIEVELRQKDIRFSSRTRSATDQFKKMQMARRTAVKLLKPKHKASGRKNEKSGQIMNTLPCKD